MSFRSIVEGLGEAFASEFKSIYFYVYYSKLLKHKGYHKLSAKLMHFSIEEMKHSDILLERIFYLNAKPTFSFPKEVKMFDTVPEILQHFGSEEGGAMTLLNDLSRLCRKEGDAGTANIAETILRDEEAHAEWFETQVRLIDELGLENYLADCLGD